jgi:4-alpha-glucanotransferase
VTSVTPAAGPARAAPDALRELARRHGVLTEHVSDRGQRVAAGAEALVAALAALGAPIDHPDGAPDALRAWHDRSWRETVAPVVVAWDGHLPGVEVRLPVAQAELGDGRAGVQAEVVTEDGRTIPVRTRLGGAPVLALTRGRVARLLPVDRRLPLGYHTLHLSGSGWSASCHLISAPSRAWWPSPAPRWWGVLLPLYAVWHRDRPGVGAFADLDAIAAAIHRSGGSFVATLPLLAGFLDGRPEPSPYAPASRLMWNELFVDVAARAAPSRPRQGLLAYQALAAAQHEALARAAVPVAVGPVVEQYARFRAVAATLGRRWRRWPANLRRPPLPPAAGDVGVEALHRFAQVEAERQLGAVAEAFRARGQRLLLDLPVGTHPDAFDVWYHPGLFLESVTIGAPPDAFFPGGQDWAIPAIDPTAARRSGHAYVRDCLRHQMRHAGILRIDHVMGLHRQWWVPAGGTAADGVYVRYPDDELFAVVCLESHRHQAMVVGEDLGTVPPAVRQALERHHLLGTHVAQFTGVDPTAEQLSSVNTHDMPTLAGWRAATDIADLAARGLVDAEEAAAAREERRAAWRALCQEAGVVRPGDGEIEAGELIGPLLEALGRTDAPLVLANLEDLWGEIRPHNVPGTNQERPNWRRRTARPLEDILDDRAVTAVWRRLDAAR